ncbi:O-methyltransferase ZRP4-like [Panicum miliaceum]|uniref:O-methyltransferase ZRP4-like n=1 Tax=Panicum miliaceum TaxID=4540 RepID=A0A3L6RH66_PANMI|nr:O-methyltransferase ZRP4-like [Panicum miliaceum]
MSSSQNEINTTSLIQGHVEFFRLIFSHLKSQALRCAGNLGIAGAIHRRGGAATISDIITETGLPQSKLPHLRRLMRVLAVSGVVAASNQPPPSAADTCTGETMYTLTPVSSLLVGGEGASPCDMSAMLRASMRPTTTAMFGHLEEWFRDDTGAESLVQMVHGSSPWTLTKNDPALNTDLNDACVAETNLVMEVVLREAGDVFRGIGSLVDVGGGLGAAAIAISRAFPQVKCTVLDLPHVISQAPEHSTVQFVAGDMFDFIPPADAIFLKGVMDSCSDEDCVKVLRQCKKAIDRDDGAGGKIIIINPVVGFGPQDDVVREALVLFDLHMMSGNGAQREEHEWKRIILEAGLSEFKVVATLGLVSVIEVRR